MRSVARRAAFAFDCAMFFVTWSALFALPVVGGIWWAYATFPQMSTGYVILDPDMTIYLTLLFSVAILFGSLAGGLTAPWKARV